MITSRIPLIDQFTKAAAQHEKHSGHLELIKASWMGCKWRQYSVQNKMVKLVKRSADGQIGQIQCRWRRTIISPSLLGADPKSKLCTTTGRAHLATLSPNNWDSGLGHCN